MECCYTEGKSTHTDSEKKKRHGELSHRRCRICTAHLWQRERERKCVCVCVCVREREREREREHVSSNISGKP